MHNISINFMKAYPWLVHAPYIGHYGYWELRQEVGRVLDFIREEIATNKKNIDYNADPTCFVNSYLKEMKRREDKGEMASFS